MIRLIVNSDDYGRSANVSRGIREAHLDGIVTSTTCMMNLPTTVADIGIALAETPDLGLGVHLVLTAGAPILPAEEVPTLVGENGMFNKLPALTERLDSIDPAQARAEWTAQIERFIHAAGRKPTHLDSHHHSSYFTAGLFEAMLELAGHYGVAIRLPKANEGRDDWAGLPQKVLGPIRSYAGPLLDRFEPRRPDAFYASFYDERATLAELTRIITSLPEGTFEIMCHPGYSDPDLIASTVYAVQRDRELTILTDPSIKALLAERGIQKINFADI